MLVIKRKIDPYQWRHERAQGRRLFMISHGVLPGFVAGVAYAALMVLFGSSFSVYLNGTVFALITTPIYLFLAYVMWEGNEEAFAEWVLKEHQRIHSLRGHQSHHSSSSEQK